ncbi:MAG: hypothetical protein EZS28_013259 [Streblomastix strix]|uniref:Phosphoribulokinase/uridine kinase domain-containing protein n=1 Tax=Streblomastix strix TaxID=222440 RepID=A0A5J4W997_9EUKA|nr:MAG: hypothetical protein EZS28_013259 [Streblomastix strix]
MLKRDCFVDCSNTLAKALSSIKNLQSIIVGIDGVTCTGKTTLCHNITQICDNANQLLVQLSGKTSRLPIIQYSVLSLDDYYKESLIDQTAIQQSFLFDHLIQLPLPLTTFARHGEQSYIDEIAEFSYVEDRHLMKDKQLCAINWDSPNAINYDKIIKDLTAWREQNCKDQTKFSKSEDSDKLDSETTISILFVEGFALLENKDLTKLFDFTFHLCICSQESILSNCKDSKGGNRGSLIINTQQLQTRRMQRAEQRNSKLVPEAEQQQHSLDYPDSIQYWELAVIPNINEHEQYIHRNTHYQKFSIRRLVEVTSTQINSLEIQEDEIKQDDADQIIIDACVLINNNNENAIEQLAEHIVKEYICKLILSKR